MSRLSDPNPLLRLDTLPPFDAIRAQDIQPAVEDILARNEADIAQLTAAADQTLDWSLMQRLDDAEDRLDKIWSTASHLNAVMNTPEMRAAYEACQPLITAYYSSLGQNQALFQCVSRLHAQADALQLSNSQRKIIRDALLDFRLAGVDLPAAEKKRFTEIEQALSRLSNDFGNNVLDATRAWSKSVRHREALQGLPESTIAAAAAAASAKGQDGYLLTLDFPCYFAVMTHADSAELRQEMYHAYATRASELDGDGSRDNCKNMDQILSYRARLAHMLDFASYADLSVARKMAATADRVSSFLLDLIEQTRPAAEREFAALCTFARKEHGINQLNAWDIAYYSEKLRKRDFDISQEELRPYFPLGRVLEGLFEITGRLYGVAITRQPDVQTWHTDVQYFEMRREGELIASFYLDLFTREGKRGGAWMSGCRNRRRLSDGTLQLPVAYLVCNFAPPAAGLPALLTHSDVTTLFHEFGHGLHHMLTQEEHLRSAGIHGVAWDAVELPSQLMENWCWEREALGLIARHHESGAPLPDALLEKMLAARTFQAGMRGIRQLEFALFDFLLHQSAGEELPQQQPGQFVSDILAAVRAQTAVFPVPAYNRFQNSFSHIFAGGYAAGYYSYKWAEVLSADVYSRFRTGGVFSPEVGSEFLRKLLGRGGGEDALILFRDFMDREPDLTALLRQEGLIA